MLFYNIYDKYNYSSVVYGKKMTKKDIEHVDDSDKVCECGHEKGIHMHVLGIEQNILNQCLAFISVDIQCPCSNFVEKFKH
jgi:hypothetical protein